MAQQELAARRRCSKTPRLNAEFSKKYAEEKAQWEAEVGNLKQSEASLKSELAAQLSKLESVTAQYDQLAWKSRRQRAKSIEKIVAAMTSEKEKALGDLEDTLTREKTEEVNSLEREYRARLEQQLNALKSESKEEMQQRIVHLDSLLNEQKATAEMTLNAFKSEATAKEAHLKAEFQASLKDAEHKADLAAAKASSARISPSHARASQAVGARGADSREAKGMRALTEQAKELQQAHALDKAQALEAQQKELSPSFFKNATPAPRVPATALAAAMSNSRFAFVKSALKTSPTSSRLRRIAQYAVRTGEV